MKEHLIHYFPFLNKEFRKLEESELQSEEVFKELLPNEPIDLSKLKAIALFQKEEGISPIILTQDSKGNIEATQNGIKLKVKRNAKI